MNNVLMYQNWPMIGLYVNLATIHKIEYSRLYMCAICDFKAGTADKIKHNVKRRRFQIKKGRIRVVRRFFIFTRQSLI